MRKNVDLQPLNLLNAFKMTFKVKYSMTRNDLKRQI